MIGRIEIAGKYKDIRQYSIDNMIFGKTGE